MSWNFNIEKAADKAEAKAGVAARHEANQLHFPESAKAVVDAAIDALPDCENSTVTVKTFGHFNGTEYRGTSNISVVVNNDFAV